MDGVSPGCLVRWLRAAGEPSRLRLLALCQTNALSVSDLAQALTQSEPRISRHLKILAEAGLIERQPQGQWVHYRIAPEAEAAGFVQSLMSRLDRRDPLIERDRAAVRDAQAAGTARESRLGRTLASLVGADTAQVPEAAGARRDASGAAQRRRRGRGPLRGAGPVAPRRPGRAGLCGAGRDCLPRARGS